MATKFEPSDKLALAISLVMESDPKDWGYAEHLTMMRYLVLQCSDAAKATIGEVEYEEKGKKLKKSALVLDGKEVVTLAVNLADLKAEFTQAGKLAECANMKKALAEDYPQFKSTAERKREYV